MAQMEPPQHLREVLGDALLTSLHIESCDAVTVREYAITQEEAPLSLDFGEIEYAPLSTSRTLILEHKGEAITLRQSGCFESWVIVSKKAASCQSRSH